LFTRVQKINKEWLFAQAAKAKYSVSEYLDLLLTSSRRYVGHSTPHLFKAVMKESSGTT